MGNVIGVIGESGSGKTTAMRNLPPEETFYIDADKKGLNWKGWRAQYSADRKNYVRTDNFTKIWNGMMVGEEMRILAMQGGDKRSAWTDLAQHGWGIVNKALEMRSDVTVIILCHSETVSDDNGIVKTRIKTNGRKLEKLVLESKMTTVVWAVRQDGKYKFILSADNSTAKVPLGAFETDEIDNDIMIVIKALEEY